MSNIARRYAGCPEYVLEYEARSPAYAHAAAFAATKGVTVIQPIVTENTPPVTINQKRGRGRPATGVALSAADRARKYRDRRRGAVAAS
jgi:hypothetical protein